MAASEKDIENIIKMLDEASATTARINLNVAEDGNDGEIRKLKHHGRCDVGSAWARVISVIKILVFCILIKIYKS